MQKLCTTIIYSIINTKNELMKFSQYDEKICCKSVIQNIFNLNELDFEVYKQLKGKKESKVENVAKILEKERSVIYRSLQRLTACKLCIKPHLIFHYQFSHTRKIFQKCHVQEKISLLTKKDFFSL